MSTGANIIVLTREGQAYSIRRHCDGHPEVVLPIIANMAEAIMASPVPVSFSGCVQTLAPPENTHCDARWAFTGAEQFLSGECDMGYGISALEPARTVLANIMNTHFTYIVDMYSTPCVLHAFCTPDPFGAFPAKMVAAQSYFPSVNEWPHKTSRMYGTSVLQIVDDQYGRLRRLGWLVNDPDSLKRVIWRCQKEVLLVDGRGDLEVMLKKEKAELMSAQPGFEVYLTMEDGTPAAWFGDADDDAHAEGLAVAHYANQDHGQVMSIDRVKTTVNSEEPIPAVACA